jgi:hypothetical protein
MYAKGRQGSRFDGYFILQYQYVIKTTFSCGPNNKGLWISPQAPDGVVGA